jgi:GNAT superfamily N-acetyltransferase
MAHDVRVVEDRFDSPVARRLVSEQQRELAGRYGFPDPDPDHLDAEQLSTTAGGYFMIAWRGEDAVACGGLRRFDETSGEIKRMYTVPNERRLGIGRAVLERIESVARDLGYLRLVLETGVEQPDAIGLYVAAGYDRIECYGVYAAFELSRCYAKDLT